MEKTESLIEQLLQEYNIEAKEVSVEFSQIDDEFVITIKGTLGNSFKEYLENLDDTLFQEICERFEEETGITLNDFAHDIDPELFKQVVANICQEKIDNLSRLIDISRQ